MALRMAEHQLLISQAAIGDIQDFLSGQLWIFPPPPFRSKILRLTHTAQHPASNLRSTSEQTVVQLKFPAELCEDACSITGGQWFLLPVSMKYFSSESPTGGALYHWSCLTPLSRSFTCL